MKYKNKRLPLVNQIKDIASQIGENYGDFYESKLLSICHELLKENKCTCKYYGKIDEVVKRKVDPNCPKHGNELLNKKCNCKTKYCKHYESDFERFIFERFIKDNPKDEKKEIEKIKPLDLWSAVRESRICNEYNENTVNDLIESKINEIIELLNSKKK